MFVLLTLQISSNQKLNTNNTKSCCFKVARLDVLGGYLPSLSINYVAISNDMGKRLPQLYYIKMKISYDLGFIAIGVAILKLLVIWVSPLGIPKTLILPLTTKLMRAK